MLYLGTTVNIIRILVAPYYTCAIWKKNAFYIRTPLFGRRWQIYPFSIAKVLFKKLLRFQDPGRPKFYFGEKGTPEEVRLTSCYIFQAFSEIGLCKKGFPPGLKGVFLLGFKVFLSELQTLNPILFGPVDHIFFRGGFEYTNHFPCITIQRWQIAIGRGHNRNNISTVCSLKGGLEGGESSHRRGEGCWGEALRVRWIYGRHSTRQLSVSCHL